MVFFRRKKKCIGNKFEELMRETIDELADEYYEVGVDRCSKCPLRGLCR